MAVTKNISFQDHLRKEIIDLLIFAPRSARDIDRVSSANYYTIRTALNDMLDKGIIRFDGYRKNAKLYALNTVESTAPNQSIPYVKQSTGRVKLTKFLGLVGKEETMASKEAIVSLPRTITRLLFMALRYKESGGTFPVGKTLDQIREEAETNIVLLENAIAIYKTLLNTEVFWSEQFIGTIPNDIDFDRDTVIEAYNHYYQK